jgi:hypothetical protein
VTGVADDFWQPTLDEGHTPVTEAGTPAALQVAHLTEQLEARDNDIEILRESLADIELALEDRGWERLSMDAARELSASGRRRIRELCRVMTIANPLMKRGLGLRKSYVWGQGVTITVRDQSDDGQDVSAVVQDFLDDPRNLQTFSGSQAHEEMEQAAYTDGELAAGLFTDQLTGKVQLRWIPIDEITDIITDPGDAVAHWYYRRDFTERTIDRLGRIVPAARTEWYPALGFEPRIKPPTLDGAPVNWDTPVRMAAVNRPAGGATRGVPDSFAAIAWARSYKEFLEQWAILMKALSRFAWQKRTRGDKVKDAAAKIAAAPAVTERGGNPAGVGAAVVNGPNDYLEAIPKTGATIDAGSGRPLAAMVAAAIDVPVTMLLGDPGVTGARAVADTLDQPMELAMSLRRAMWTALMVDVLNHVIDWAVRAPQGPLKGRIRREGDRVIVELPDGDDRTIDITWPEFDSTPVETLVKAIVEADGTQTMPPLVVLRLLLQALKVDNVDEILDEVTDDDGNFIPPEGAAGQAATDAFRRGEDPAAALNGDPDDEDDEDEDEPDPDDEDR